MTGVRRFNLREARMNAGLSQRELADATGVPLKTVQRIEDGKGARPGNAKKLADWATATTGSLVQVTDLMPLEQVA